MVDVILIAVLLVMVGSAVVYIKKEKKKGVKCIGCPAAGNCSHNCNGASGSCSPTDTKE